MVAVPFVAFSRKQLEDRWMLLTPLEAHYYHTHAYVQAHYIYDIANIRQFAYSGFLHSYVSSIQSV